MQEHRTARPHDADACPTCAPTGPGHWLCQADGCEQLASGTDPATGAALGYQTRRHATQAEYDVLPVQFQPIDGLCMMAVFACDDDEHAQATAAFCTHPEPTPGPCPTCKAEGDDPCTTTNGAPRALPHAARASAQPVAERCLHAHREDCGVFEGCQCTTEDQAPTRTPRPRTPVENIDGSRSKIPFELAKPIVEAHDIPWWTVRAIATVQAQDAETPALDVTRAELDPDGNLLHDEHGHEVTETVRILLDPNVLPPALAAGSAAHATG